MTNVAPSRDLVVIGASAGGVPTLKRVVADLPADLEAAVCVVLHIAPRSPSALATILSRAGPLSCRQAIDEDELRAGEILVAPPDRHLEISDDHARLSVGPKENGHRPAVDTLFRSASEARDGRVIGVILSGNRDDGAAGLATIKANGGLTIVQDPEDALFTGMPASALAHVPVDAVVPLERIARTITSMVRSEEPYAARVMTQPGSIPSAARSIAVCPECGGVLTEERQAGVLQWHCHVGHRYSPESLADAQGTSVEAALWAAARALEERAALMQRLAQQSEARGYGHVARNFRAKASDALGQSRQVRAVLETAASSFEALGKDEPDDIAREALS